MAPAVRPDWVVGEMPPGYHNRLEEIERLTADLQAMGRFASLLSDVGPPLGEAVRDLFVALRFEAELLPGPVCTRVAVSLEDAGRLLLHVSAEAQRVQKKSPEIAHVFQMLHELADDRDRVVFVTNVEPATRPAERGEALATDAQAFLKRMGTTHVAATTLFSLWKLSQQEPDRARELVQRLYQFEGGTFQLPRATV